jgi:hypothetical protein
MLEDVRVNTNTMFHTPSKTSTSDLDFSELDLPNENLDGDDETTSCRFVSTSHITTHQMRLIDASCKAFLIRRGLEPEVSRYTRFFRF